MSAATDGGGGSGFDLIYFHGWGNTKPSEETCAPLRAMTEADRQRYGGRVHVFAYHPYGVVKETRLSAALEEAKAFIEACPGGKCHVIGWSYGGLIGALIASLWPDLVASLVLLAPAVDNYARNFEGMANLGACAGRTPNFELCAPLLLFLSLSTADELHRMLRDCV